MGNEMSTTMEGVRVAQKTEVLAKAQRQRFTAAEYSLGDAFVSEPWCHSKENSV